MTTAQSDFRRRSLRPPSAAAPPRRASRRRRSPAAARARPPAAEPRAPRSLIVGCTIPLWAEDLAHLLVGVGVVAALLQPLCHPLARAAAGDLEYEAREAEHEHEASVEHELDDGADRGVRDVVEVRPAPRQAGGKRTRRQTTPHAKLKLWSAPSASGRSAPSMRCCPALQRLPTVECAMREREHFDVRRV